MYHLASVLGALVAAKLPIKDETLRIGCAFAAGEGMEKAMDWTSKYFCDGKFKSLRFLAPPAKIAIRDRTTSDKRKNPYYSAMTRLILSGGGSSIPSYLAMEPVDGKAGLVPAGDGDATMKLGDKEVSVSCVSLNGNSTGGATMEIVLSSRHMTPKEIFDRMVPILDGLEKNIPREITIHTLTTDENRHSAWDTKIRPTTKSLCNLFLPTGVGDKLLADVRDFIQGGPSEYVRLGEPYTFGRLLYGPPGTGKTSFVRALAAEYDMEMYSAKIYRYGNSDLMETLSNIDGHGKCHIVFFDDDSAITGIDPDCDTITSMSSFLDGPIEGYGRLVFLSTNHTPENISKRPEITRRLPLIEFGFCDAGQLTKITKLYRPSSSSGADLTKAADKITPSNYQRLLKNASFPLEKIIDEISSCEAGTKIELIEAALVGGDAAKKAAETKSEKKEESPDNDKNRNEKLKQREFENRQKVLEAEGELQTTKLALEQIEVEVKMMTAEAERRRLARLVESDDSGGPPSALKTAMAPMISAASPAAVPHACS